MVVVMALSAVVGPDGGHPTPRTRRSARRAGGCRDRQGPESRDVTTSARLRPTRANPIHIGSARGIRIPRAAPGPPQGRRRARPRRGNRAGSTSGGRRPSHAGCGGPTRASRRPVRRPLAAGQVRLARVGMFRMRGSEVAAPGKPGSHRLPSRGSSRPTKAARPICASRPDDSHPRTGAGIRAPRSPIESRRRPPARAGRRARSGDPARGRRRSGRSPSPHRLSPGRRKSHAWMPRRWAQATPAAAGGGRRPAGVARPAPAPAGAGRRVRPAPTAARARPSARSPAAPSARPRAERRWVGAPHPPRTPSGRA